MLQVKVTFENAAQEIMDAEDNTTKDHNAALEDTSDDEETNVFIRTRLSKVKHRISQNRDQHRENAHKFNFKPEKVNEMLVNDAESPSTPSNHHKRHTHRKFIEMQHQLYKLQQSLRSNEEIDMRVSRPKRDGQKLDGGNYNIFTVLQLGRCMFFES